MPGEVGWGGVDWDGMQWDEWGQEGTHAMQSVGVASHARALLFTKHGHKDTGVARTREANSRKSEKAK